MRNVSCVSESRMCSGCGACVVICPRKVIDLKTTSLGRLYASVGHDCIDCGLCQMVCPSYSLNYNEQDFFSVNKSLVAIGRAKDHLYYLNGQSGGALTAVLSFLFDSDKIEAALVCKPCSNGRGEPYIITDKEQLNVCQGSQYTPVTLLSAVNSLQSYSSVAVVGLPCHMSGLDRLMRVRRIPVKYKLGLICDRTLCGTITDSIRRYLQLQECDDMMIRWRDKNVPGYTYYNAPVSIRLANDDVAIISSKVRQKLKTTFTAPRCLVCPDKLNISADIVFGDPWNISFNSDKGESLVIANNSIGEEILSEALREECIILSNVDSANLDVSQHITLRKSQVLLYSKLFNRKAKRMLGYTKCKEDIKIALPEYVRAIINLFRFYVLEKLPKKWVVELTASMIAKMNK